MREHQGQNPVTPVRSNGREPGTLTHEAWMASAGGRPAWECWGKAYSGQGCPAHALLCHLLDVAAVAYHLLTTHTSRAMRQRLLGLVPSRDEASLKLLLFVIALHDFGKYTPGFQMKLDWAKTQLQARGFDLQPPAKARPAGRPQGANRK